MLQSSDPVPIPFYVSLQASSPVQPPVPKRPRHAGYSAVPGGGAGPGGPVGSPASSGSRAPMDAATRESVRINKSLTASGNNPQVPHPLPLIRRAGVLFKAPKL